MELNIRPSVDLRNKYNGISKQCRDIREMVIITVNGRGDTAEDFAGGMADAVIITVNGRGDKASTIQKGKYKMDIFGKIKKDIMRDPMNDSYTNRGIEPLYNVSERAKIVVVGQAPGRVAEETGLYWNDLSGDRLRDWMGVSREIFYESDLIAQIPMDFYFPGKAKSGDAPPRKGFAEKWHPLLLKEMPEVKTIMLVGTYAQKHYLGKKGERNLTETVKNFKKYLPEYFPLIHPSPLNFRWMKKNPWFEEEVIPVLKQLIKETLDI